MTNKEKSALTQVEYLLFIYREDNGKKFKSTANLFDWDMEAIDTLVQLVRRQEDMLQDSENITSEMAQDMNKMCKELKLKNRIIADMSDFMVGGLEEDIFRNICRKSKCKYELRDNRPTGCRKCQDCIREFFERRNYEL